MIVADGFSYKTKIEQGETGRRASHVAQVMQMARDHGPDGYRGGLPEAPYYENRPAPSRRQRGLRLAVPGVAAAAAVATAAGVLARR